MYSKAFQIIGCGALTLSAMTAMVLPEVADAAPTRVRVAGTARVNITNIPSVNLNGTPLVRLEPGTQVSLQPGSAVSLQPGSTVSLDPSSAVTLAPDAKVGLADGATVKLDAATTVKVSSDTPVPVQDGSASHAVQHALTLSMGTGLATDFENISVPADQILVIEYLSCSAILPGGNLYAEVTTTAGGVTGLHSFVPATSFQNGGNPHFIMSTPTRLYADPGTTVRLNIVRTSTLGSVSDFPCTISGYYVSSN
jgi:hypothetical protein